MCSYFDPLNKPSGGPRRKTEPGHESRRSKISQRRKRREIEEETEAEYEEMEELSDLLPAEDDILGARRMDQKLIDRIQNSENFFDIMEMAFEKRKNTNGLPSFIQHRIPSYPTQFYQPIFSHSSTELRFGQSMEATSYSLSQMDPPLPGRLSLRTTCYTIRN